jgi:hypothetical protein
MTFIPCGICHGICTGHGGTGWTYPVSTAALNVSPQLRLSLSDGDIERIAKRVVELMKGSAEE